MKRLLGIARSSDSSSGLDHDGVGDFVGFGFAEQLCHQREAELNGRSRAAWLVVGAVALLALVAATAVFRTNPGGAPIRVAVVPFDNETGSTEYDLIAGGVAAATVARLATPDRLARVAVIGNAAVLRRPRAFRDLKAIGQELEAEYVVLAQVKSEGGDFLRLA